ncbi:glycoside hydrolase family 73 protein [Limosilactobacillus rudii]|nr:glucosaminidase domain-containing protein [Limosilactobacillus rudii]
MMLKQQMIIGAMIMLMGLSGQGVKADSLQQAARHDASEAVKDFCQVDEEELANHDEEYINAYLTEYEQALNEYATSVNHGYKNVIDDTVDQSAGESDEKETRDKTTLQNRENNLKVDDHIYPPQLPSDYQAKFINRIAKAAQKIGQEYDLYPSVIIAQAILESDWGRSTLSRAPYYNLFGVKGYFANRTINQPTIEYDRHGRQFTIFSNFCQYKNESESLRNYAKTLEAPLYSGVHRKKATNYRIATKALLGCYATDPDYDQKLNKLIDTYQLTKYDLSPHDNKSVKALPISNNNENIRPIPMVSKHSVKAKKDNNHVPHYLSLLGGLGTAGIIEFWHKLKGQRE